MSYEDIIKDKAYYLWLDGYSNDSEKIITEQKNYMTWN